MTCWKCCFKCPFLYVWFSSSMFLTRNFCCVLSVFIELCLNPKVRSMKLTRLLRFVLTCALSHPKKHPKVKLHIFLLCTNTFVLLIKSASNYHPAKAMHWSRAVMQSTAGISLSWSMEMCLLLTLWLGVRYGLFSWSDLMQICYHVLGLVHGIWTPIPRAVRILLSFVLKR